MFVSAQGAPAAVQARRRARVWLVHAGRPRSSGLAHGQEQDLPGSLTIHPVTLRRSTTPDDPSRLAYSGASSAAPGQLTPKASSFYGFRGFLRRFITCCLRFTTGVAARHARLASGWQAAPLPGGSRTRWIATRGFSSIHSILLSRAYPGAITVPSSRGDTDNDFRRCTRRSPSGPGHAPPHGPCHTLNHIRHRVAPQKCPPPRAAAGGARGAGGALHPSSRRICAGNGGCSRRVTQNRSEPLS